MMDPSFQPTIDEQLLIRFLDGEASAQERQQIRDWAQADCQHQQYLEQMTWLWHSSAQAKDFASIDVPRDFKKVKARLAIGRQEAISQPLPSKTHWWKPLAKIAAAVVLLLGIGLGFKTPLRQLLFHRDNITEATTHPVTVTLSDGTRVHLNTNARLTYPESFPGHERTVTLTGEAFFEVAKNQEKPFVIASGAVLTRVLGTSFLVNAAREDSVLVSVVTGKVALFAPGKRTGQLTMTPGERGTYLRGALTKAPYRDVNLLAWKTGQLIFHNAPLREVANDLSHYFHQPFRLQTKELESCALSSTFNRPSLEEVLAELPLVLPVQIVRKSQVIMITGEGCQ
ncbi:MAG: FecR domain-containing protein [Ferruginibacter sp.]|nr:FecR domain-containing protein [Cytophagales bacterium]